MSVTVKKLAQFFVLAPMSPLKALVLVGLLGFGMVNGGVCSDSEDANVNLPMQIDKGKKAPLLLPSHQSAQTSYWVWQRSVPLLSDEIMALDKAGVTSLYWHYGTMTCSHGEWIWKSRYGMPSLPSINGKTSPRLIPVIRLEPMGDHPFSGDDFRILIPKLNQIASDLRVPFLQIDYEAPDRLIPVYREFLRDLKSRAYPWYLSITALAHWSRFTNEFTGLVDEITPMFYDLGSGHEKLVGGRLPAMVSGEAIGQIKSWSACPIPWRAGLPNFRRVSVVDRSGANRGNLHSFNIDEIWFSPLLETDSPTIDGETVFRVIKDGTLGDMPLQSGEKIVVREPRLVDLIALKKVALTNGAKSVVYFQKAKLGDDSGYSTQSLSQDVEALPELKIHRTKNGCVEITNDSETDLVPMASVGVRGYAVALKASAGAWREAIAGEFALITTDRAGLKPIKDQPPSEAGILYLWFSHLPAGKTLSSGLLQTVPDKGIDFQIFQPTSVTSWQHLE